MSEPKPFTRSYWNENWHRTWADWDDRQALVGFALLVLAFLGYGWISQDKTMSLIGVYVSGLYVALQFLVITPHRMWNDARSRIGELEERQRPRLHLTFEPDELPYVQDFPPDGTTLTRIYRVGIRNDSSLIIENVRVVLESCTWQSDDGELTGMPAIQSPVLIEHAFRIMGSGKKHGLINLAPGDRPTAFVDVVAQKHELGGPVARFMSPCYASGHATIIPTRPGAWIFGLRVEGGGTFNYGRYRVAPDPGGLIVMSPYAVV